jgi:hypothetical protein
MWTLVLIVAMMADGASLRITSWDNFGSREKCEIAAKELDISLSNPLATRTMHTYAKCIER